MRKLNLEYLFKDKETSNPSDLSDYDTLDIISNNHHIYGEILWPDGNDSLPRPCVIMLHGFPGSARNDDIAHALCRIGCVVMVPHHRGAWGSEGKYLISNCIEDAKNLVAHAQSAEFCSKYIINPNMIILLGHSMGANTALNAGKHIPDLRGIVLIAPFDPTRYLYNGKEEALLALLKEGKVLQSDGEACIYRDIELHKEQMCFEKAFKLVKDRNILCLAGKYDSCAPISEMVQPLWNKLNAHTTNAIWPCQDVPSGCCSQPLPQRRAGRRTSPHQPAAW